MTYMMLLNCALKLVEEIILVKEEIHKGVSVLLK